MEKESEQKITSDIFFDLYQKVFNDEEVVKIIDAAGITIIRKYEEETEYFKDGKRMFIKLYIREGYIIGSVDMVKRNEDKTFTIITDEGKYKKRFTNFFFNKNENITFDLENKKILALKKHKEYNINDFVNLLVKNHLSDRLFLRRKINRIKAFLLKLIFWSMDYKYDWINYYHRIHEGRQKTNQAGANEDLGVPLKEDPFFKYFKIYRKILLIFVIIITAIIIYFFEKVNASRHLFDRGLYSIFKVENFTIANPILLFSFFICLCLLHYLSLFLNEKTYDKAGFIYKLHNSSLNDSFSLKI